MSLSNFPSDIKTYFDVIRKQFGTEKSLLPTKEPWYFKCGKKLFTQLHPDQAVKRFNLANWLDLKSLYLLQVSRSIFSKSELGQRSHFHSVCNTSPHSRNFGQQPCTINSINIRVEAIQKLVAKDAPLLILGDDDALSIALAKNGFTDITVFEIDKDVVKHLAIAFTHFKNAKITIKQQDILQEIPKNLKREYALVTFDPWYAIDGLEAFMNCALKATLGPKPIILLSFNCGALLAEFLQFERIILFMKYKIHSWLPLANMYPMPRGLQRSIEFAEFIVLLFSFKFVIPFRKERLFLSSDLMILTPE